MQPKDEGSLPIRSKNGRKELARPNRTQLLFEFDMQREVQAREQPELDYFLPDPYPPSTVPLSQLKLCCIADLEPNKRQVGSVLFVKTIETGLRAAAIRTIVEDEEGLAERLAVYNVDLSIDAEELLPEDSLLAIKEPSLTSSPSGGYTVRVDHPSDLLILDPYDSRISERLRRATKNGSPAAVDFKQDGNAAYGKRKYLAAINAYTSGLRVCRDEDDTKYDLLRNRAAANIFLGRFKEAQSDAQAAVVPSKGEVDEKVRSLNIKAYERAGHAAYSQAKWSEAQILYEKALELSPGGKESTEALAKIKERILEQTSGYYDFEKMSRSVNKKRNRLDHASYFAKTEIRDAGKHGRGFFATDKFKAGDLIMCEKAMSIWFDTDPTPGYVAILNSKAKRKAIGTQPPLLFNVCEKLSRDIDTARVFFKLYGGESAGAQPQEVDGLVSVDTFGALAILDHNSIACPTTRSSSKEAQAQLSGTGYPSTGLWSRMSYINHACNGNAMRSFIGDMMIVRATRDIADGEEIFMPYRLPNVDSTATRNEIERIWGFKCDCELCVAEGSTTTGQRKQRLQAQDKVRDLIGKQGGSINLAAAEELFKKTWASYNEVRFDGKPRVGLFAPAWVLCTGYHQTKDWKKLAEAAINLLKALGFHVQIEHDELEVKRQHNLTEPIGINAALYAEFAYARLKREKLAKQFLELGRSLWMISYGAERGFEDKTKELTG